MLFIDERTRHRATGRRISSTARRVARRTACRQDGPYHGTTRRQPHVAMTSVTLYRSVAPASLSVRSRDVRAPTTLTTASSCRSFDHSELLNPLTPTVAIWVQLRAERQSARMSKITNDGLTRSGTGCFIPIWQQWASKG